jgi:hypothetical protein
MHIIALILLIEEMELKAGRQQAQTSSKFFLLTFSLPSAFFFVY